VRKYPGVKFQVAAKRGKIKAMAEGAAQGNHQKLKRSKLRLRAFVSNPFM